ncbi:MAG: LD-carboxypeptidase [Verrucomicrobiales bacterium]|nr:LD-carboxypeptidase [Verrucomicrobiales bacterium]
MSLPSPRPVSAGSRLGIVAPAGPFDQEAFQRGVAWLEERYEVVHDDAIFTESGYFAGSDSRRREELNRAVADPSIDAILCARGGYGCTRLLPGIDPGAVRDANKLIVGFSDVTALHTLWNQAGVQSIHAPMVAALGSAPDPVRTSWIATLEQTGPDRQWDLCRLDGNCESSGEGILFGGNLAVLGALNGTPFAPDLAGKILFIEDVGERPYRVDRMLTTLAQSGWFDEITGLVVGAFTEGDPGTDGVSIDDVFTAQFATAEFPVLTGLSAGHITDNEPLPFGVTARIEGNSLTVTA